MVVTVSTFLLVTCTNTSLKFKEETGITGNPPTDGRPWPALHGILMLTAQNHLLAWVGLEVQNLLFYPCLDTQLFPA